MSWVCSSWRVQLEVADTSWKLSKSYFHRQGVEVEVVLERLGHVERLIVHLVSGRHIDGIRRALVNALVENTGIDAQCIHGLHQQGGAAAAQSFPVRIGEVFRDRSRCDIAALGAVAHLERKRIQHLAIDPAADVLIGADDAQGCDALHEGQIQHRIFGVVETTAVGAREHAFGVDIEVLQVRLVGHEFDRAAHGAGAIEGALRAAQDFDPVEIEQGRVDHHFAVLRHGRWCQGGFVEVEAYRGRLSAGRGEATHLQLGLPGTGGLERDTGDLLSDGYEVGNTLCL